MSRKIFIDLTDLIVYAANFDQISGIQRVEIELIKLIFEKYPAIEIVNAFEVDSSKLKSIIGRYLGNERALLHELNRAFSHCNAGPKHQRRKPLHLALKALWMNIARRYCWQMPTFTADDLVFVPGGFCFDPFRIAFYRHIAAIGSRLVFWVHDVLPITQGQFVAGTNLDVFAPAFHLPADIITTTHFNVADFARAYRIVTQAAPLALPQVVALAHEFPGAPRNAKPETASTRLIDAVQTRAFVLCVGTVEIRKNHLALLECWRALKATYGEALPLLVIAGRRGWKAEAALEILDHAQARADPFVFIESPSDEELKWLYAACDFSVFPSLFEGWGLPVGESLWFGKACAASRASSIPEVGGDLCVYFDPGDAEAMKAAIARLLDPTVRQGFEAKIKTAPLRCWSDVAEDLLGVLFQITNEPRVVAAPPQFP